MSDKTRRHGSVEPATDAIARALRGIDMPVPESLPDMMAVPGSALPPAAPALDRAQRIAHLRSLGWPKRALDVALVADTSKPGIALIDAWDPKLSAIVLASPPSTGKTVAAAWWALSSVKVFRFVRAAELVRVGRFDNGWDEWLAAPALCIDDLGAEYMDPKGSWLSDLDLLLDTFYSDARPLIITTNCTGVDFVERYGRRINERIMECAVWAAVDGPSLRGGGR